MPTLTNFSTLSYGDFRINEFEEEIQKVSLQHFGISVKFTINSQGDFDILKSIMSKESLNFNNLTLNVSDKIRDEFFKDFKSLSNKATIHSLTIQNTDLTESNLEHFFENLSKFKDLTSLQLKEGYFDYQSCLQFLGVYLAKDPKLRTITLSNPRIHVGERLKSGDSAQALYDSLSKNTHLTGFYVDGRGERALSSDISGKLGENRKIKEDRRNHEMKQKATDALLRISFVDTLPKSIKEELERISNLTSKPSTSGTSLKVKFPPEYQKYKSLYFVIAKNDSLKNHSVIQGQKKDVDWYLKQTRVLDALAKMYTIELNASDNDKPILHKLREDCLTEWKKVVNNKDVDKRNEQMGVMFEGMINDCQTASRQVKDKTSYAAIKNLLLAVSAVLTLGVSLLIYSATAETSIKKRGSFFYKNQEVSKEGIDELSQSIEEAKNFKNN